jgi:hypothetical protein
MKDFLEVGTRFRHGVESVSERLSIAVPDSGSFVFLVFSEPYVLVVLFGRQSFFRVFDCRGDKGFFAIYHLY